MSLTGAARCLDLTRLISRAGRGPLTGIDRVELAYLRALVADETPLFLLVRTWLGFQLLDQDGAQSVLDRFDGVTPWGSVDLVGRLQRKAHPTKRRWEADLRRLSVARARHQRLGDMLATWIPKGSTYLNVGHSNLTEQGLLAWNRVQGSRVSVLVHDMIPLDFPQYQRPGTVASFERKMRSAAAYADVVICISAETQRRVQHWFGKWGRQPRTCVAHIGVDPPVAASHPVLFPSGLPPERPFFVSVGTIEPRKNHALLLDIWEVLGAELGADTPGLVIAGSRGWNNQKVFDRLDMATKQGARIQEVGGLSDQQLSTLIRNSAGLLFPSLAEGYGLPPVEALQLDVPVVCSELPVLREVLGNNAIYADVGDMYSWKQSILRLADNNRAEHRKMSGQAREKPVWTWSGHFNLVLKET